MPRTGKPRQEVCNRGHPFNAENTYEYLNGKYVNRSCRICARERNTFRQRLYGVPLEVYRAKLAAQDGRCAICGGPPGKRSLNVDHDHATGQVRDLLCAACNTGIGALRDDPELMRKAAEYIERHRETRVA
ncbi:MAG: endonuclease VII domain-containing protein [Candidatus Acidiferrum sp.]